MDESSMHNMTRSTFVVVGDARCADVYVKVLGVYYIRIVVMMRAPEGKNGVHYFHWVQNGKTDIEHPDEYATLDEAVDAAETKIREALAEACTAKIEVDI